MAVKRNMKSLINGENKQCNDKQLRLLRQVDCSVQTKYMAIYRWNLLACVMREKIHEHRVVIWPSFYRLEAKGFALQFTPIWEKLAYVEFWLFKSFSSTSWNLWTDGIKFFAHRVIIFEYEATSTIRSICFRLFGSIVENCRLQCHWFKLSTAQLSIDFLLYLPNNNEWLYRLHIFLR